MPLRKQKKRSQRGAEYLQTKADEVLEIKSSQEYKAKARARYLGNPEYQNDMIKSVLQALKDSDIRNDMMKTVLLKDSDIRMT